MTRMRATPHLCPVCLRRPTAPPWPVCSTCAPLFGLGPMPELSQEASAAPDNRALLAEVYGAADEPKKRARKPKPIAGSSDGLCHCSDAANVAPHARVIVCQQLRASRRYKAPAVLAGQLRMGG
jgi:hypothetical protein